MDERQLNGITYRLDLMLLNIYTVYDLCGTYMHNIRIAIGGLSFVGSKRQSYLLLAYTLKKDD